MNMSNTIGASAALHVDGLAHDAQPHAKRHATATTNRSQP
ncbi:MAG: hypothetical protein JWP52_2756 [Rhizobacter sp.]|nr:hypothetical protein [Rhizobacter sp.]